jgi:hypothetical protein
MRYGRAWLASRLLAGLFSLTFLFIQAGLEPRHACPLHEAPPQAAPVSSDQHAHHAPADDSESSESCCTCIGSCLAGGVVAAPSATVAIGWVQTTHNVRSRIVRASARTQPLPRLLPFANAPPLS